METEVDLSKLRFSQSSVKATFKDGRKLDDLVQALRSKAVSPNDLPTLNVFMDEDGTLWCLDNRRLLALKTAFYGKLRLKVNIYTEDLDEDRFLEWVDKMTTSTDGATIRVRDGQPAMMPRQGKNGAYFVYLNSEDKRDRKVYVSQLTTAQKEHLVQTAKESNNAAFLQAVEAALRCGKEQVGGASTAENTADDDDDDDYRPALDSNAFRQWQRGMRFATNLPEKTLPGEKLPLDKNVDSVCTNVTDKSVPLNAWNAFQQANAGKGWTQNEMLAQYNKYKMSPASPLVDHEATPSSKSATTHVVRNASTAPVNDWNAFQHDHAGRGWDKKRMLMEYEARQARPATAVAKVTVVNSTAGSSVTYASSGGGGIRYTSSSSYSSGGGGASQSMPSNSWNAFQQAHAGHGYSRAEMQSNYHASSTTAGASSGGGNGHTGSSSSYPSGGGGLSQSTPSNPWNAFQQAHAGQGYSRAEMQSMYRASRTD